MTRQCELLGVARSSVYYQPVPVDEDDLEVMARIDQIHLARPFLGSRRIADELRADGLIVNRKRVRRLMTIMGITAIYPKKQTSNPNPAHKVYPYLLRGLKIEAANQVWCSDITYIPMASGFLYLVAVMDWHSRKVLSWKVSNTLDTRFCVQALQEALERYPAPEIFNTDQGAQFTATAFTSVLEEAGIQVSMDGKGRWMDNVFIERLWRSVKYEEVYLHAYENGSQARAGLAGYFEYYNTRRGHQGLAGATPDQVHSHHQPLPQAA